MIQTTSRRNAAHRQPARYTSALLSGLTSALVASMLAGAAHAAPTATGDRAVTRLLAAKTASGCSSVILKTAGALTPTQEARLHTLGADITARLPLIGSVAVRVPSRRLAQVAALPFVTHVSLDGAVQKSDEFTVGSSEADQAYEVDGYGGQYKLTGSGVTVAVVDSGVAPSQDLSTVASGLLGVSKSRILARANFAADDTGAGTGYGSGTGLTLDLSGGRGQILNLTTGGTSVLQLGPANNGSLYDLCGHGTHVAGIIGGNGAKSSGGGYYHTFGGIAPQSSLVNVRVLDGSGQADVSTVISGLQWAVDNRAKYHIRVLNLSLGHPVGESYKTDPLCRAVEAAWKAGIVVVCAAGNEGRFGAVNLAGASNEGWGTAYGSINSPANDPSVITVGAAKRMDVSRANDKIATYSGRGPSRVDLILKPDLIAPGNKVISLDSNNSTLDNYAGNTNDIPQSSYKHPDLFSLFGPPQAASFDYFQLSGTSMAAPVVAGAAALMLQADPTLTPDTIKARLMLSADKWAAPDGTGDALTYGAGYLNIPAALACAVTATQPALSPALALNGDGSVSLVMDRAAWGSGLWGTGITDLRAAWGSSVGADRAAWGSSANADGTTSLFMDRAAWGSSALSMDRAAWGSTATSADRAAWGSALTSADRAAWGSALTSADRAAWGSSSPSVDLTSTAISGE